MVDEADVHGLEHHQKKAGQRTGHQEMGAPAVHIPEMQLVGVLRHPASCWKRV